MERVRGERLKDLEVIMVEEGCWIGWKEVGEGYEKIVEMG